MRAYQRTLSGASLFTLATLSAPAWAQEAPAAQPNPTCPNGAPPASDGSCIGQQIPSAGSQTPTEAPESVNQSPSAGTVGADTIVVTGSRIAHRGYDTVEPVQVLSSQQIEARGFNTLGQALNELPSFGVPDSSPVGLQSSFGPGQSFV